MKIAIYNPYNFLKPGGVQDHVKAQAEVLRDLGHTVTVLTPRPRKFHDPTPKGTLLIGVSARVSAQSSSVDISAAVDEQDVQKIFKENVFDVVHFHEPVVPFVGRQLIANCPYPVVATLHAALPETVVGRSLGSIKPYFRSIIQYVDVLTKVSPAAGEYLGELVDGHEVFMVPNGLRLTKLKRAVSMKSRDKKRIAYVGRLEKRKGVKYLLYALAEIQALDNEISLDILGDGPERSKLEHLAQELNLINVRFLGYQDDSVKFDLLSKATVACYPALYGESFGIVLLEAMAMGIPIVAGDNPGYRSVLKEKGMLSLVDPSNTEEFAEKLKLFLHDQDFATMMSDWGKKYVKQFDYKLIVDEYVRIYNYAIEKHQHTPVHKAATQKT